MRLLLMLGGLLSLVGCSGQALVNAFTPGNGYQRHADIAYGGEPRQRLDVYMPEDLSHPAPVVVYLYGGRWEEGDKNGYKFIGQALTSIGCVAVVADYRLYPQVKFPAFVEDGAAAVAWTHAHASDYGGDPDRLFVMGHSAGAHIAAMLTLDPEYLRQVGGSPDWLAGMIGLAGPYDFLPLEAEDLRDIFGPPERFPESQPINFVSGDNPPMLLLAGTEDHTVYPRNSRNLAAAVSQAGGPVALKLYPGTGHIRIVAALAAPLRFLGDQLRDIDGFIEQAAAADAEPAE